MIPVANARSSLLTGAWTNDLPPIDLIFGSSAPLQDLRRRIERVATANVPVLIQGESGTGKEVIARFLHNRSRGVSSPFVKINCPAIPSALFESELFGYEKGAFTGAYGVKAGRVEIAERGTLFLDEISELDAGLQAKLLQFLQDGHFCRIGAQEDRRVEVRIVCATNRRLVDEVEAGTFRQDLFYRINVVDLQLPPLRERSEDIPKLVDYLLMYYNQKYDGQAGPLLPSLLRRLQSYSWPGNIRQLENLIKRYVVLGLEETIYSELEVRNRDFFPYFNPKILADGSASLKQVTRQVVREVERKIILEALRAHRWNRKQVARALKISYRALLYKLKDAGVVRKRTRPPIAACRMDSDN